MVLNWQRILLNSKKQEIAVALLTRAAAVFDLVQAACMDFLYCSQNWAAKRLWMRESCGLKEGHFMKNV